MSQTRHIAQNTLALLLSNVANKILGFLIMLTVARFLGTANFGLYTYVFAYVAMFALATDLGLSTVVVRGLTQDDEAGRRWLGTALLLRWPLALTAYAGSVGGAYSLYGFDEYTRLIALSSLSFLTVPLSTHAAVFTARMKQYGPALISLGSRIVLFGIILWLASSGGSLYALIGAEVLVGSLTNLGLWIWSRSLLRPSYAFSTSMARQLLNEGIPLFLSSVFIALYFRIDVFFLKHFRDEAAIGVYAAAYRVTESMPLVAAALTNSLFPVLCQHVHSGNAASVSKLVRSSLKILLVVIIPTALVVASYSGPVTQVLYGGRFKDSAQLMSILVFGQILVYTNVLLTTLIVARGRTQWLMILTIGMVLFNVSLNYFVIPVYGALGAAATTVATEMAGTIGALLLTSSSRIFLQVMARILIPACACAAILAIFSPRTPDWTLSSFWPILAVAVIYPACLFFFRVFDQEEWERLQKLAW
ncbi:MAG TPA: flippase [Acidobacteriota bacterium]